MNDKLLQVINELLIGKNKKPLNGLNKNYSLRNDFGFDSLDLAELTVKIEYEFGVDVFEDGLVETLGEIMSKLER